MSWQHARTATPLQYRELIAALGLTQEAAGRLVGVSDRTAHRYCTGHAKIPASVVLLLRSMIHHRDHPVVPKWKGRQQPPV